MITVEQLTKALEDACDYCDVDVSYEEGLGKVLVERGFAPGYEDDANEVGLAVTGEFTAAQYRCMHIGLDMPEFSELAERGIRAFPLP